MSALINPRSNQVNLRSIQCPAILGWRHALVVIGRDPFHQQALVGCPRLDNPATIATLQHERPRLQAEFGLLFDRPVT